MNILITSASRKVSLVLAFKDALAQEGNGSVVAVDASRFSPALYFADEHYLIPPSHNPECLEILIALCKRIDIKLIIPTRDEELPWFVCYKEKFREIGTSVMVGDEFTIKICQDKKLFNKFCNDNNFDTPINYEVTDLDSNLQFPLFIKPRFGKSGNHTLIVNTKEELEILLDKMPNAIIQEVVQEPEYTIDLFADFSGKVISVVPRERIYIFGGESFVSRTCKNEYLIQQSIRLAETLGLIGHNTIQCFYDNGLVKFIEVNPRFGGAANLSFAAGAPTPLFLVKLLKGENVESRIGDFKDNFIMLRYTDDLFLSGDLISQGK